MLCSHQHRNMFRVNMLQLNTFLVNMFAISLFILVFNFKARFTHPIIHAVVLNKQITIKLA